MPSRYDDELWELVPENPGPPPEVLSDFVRRLGHEKRVLDLGAGDGRLTELLDADLLVAADVSPVALERARRRLSADTRIVELQPYAPLPFADSAFDLVLCAETVEHVRDVGVARFGRVDHNRRRRFRKAHVGNREQLAVVKRGI